MRVGNVAVHDGRAANRIVVAVDLALLQLIHRFFAVDVLRNAGVLNRVGTVIVIGDGTVLVVGRGSSVVHQQAEIIRKLLGIGADAVLVVGVIPCLGELDVDLFILVGVVHIELDIRHVDRTRGGRAFNLGLFGIVLLR